MKMNFSKMAPFICRFYCMENVFWEGVMKCNISFQITGIEKIKYRRQYKVAGKIHKANVKLCAKKMTRVKSTRSAFHFYVLKIIEIGLQKHLETYFSIPTEDTIPFVFFLSYKRQKNLVGRKS